MWSVSCSCDDVVAEAVDLRRVGDVAEVRRDAGAGRAPRSRRASPSRRASRSGRRTWRRSTPGPRAARRARRPCRCRPPVTTATLPLNDSMTTPSVEAATLSTAAQRRSTRNGKRARVSATTAGSTSPTRIASRSSADHDLLAERTDDGAVAAVVEAVARTDAVHRHDVRLVLDGAVHAPASSSASGATPASSRPRRSSRCRTRAARTRRRTGGRSRRRGSASRPRPSR